MNYLYIGLGGAIGSLLRYFISIYTTQWWENGFPIGTLIANWSGAFTLAWFTKYIIERNRLNHHITLFIGTGLIGAYTTFSTLSVETVALIQEKEFLIAFIYVSLSIAGGLILAFIGSTLGSGKLAGEKE